METPWMGQGEEGMERPPVVDGLDAASGSWAGFGAEPYAHRKDSPRRAALRLFLTRAILQVPCRSCP